MRASFDVIAAGSNLATTLAAALLARRGQRVLLVPGRRPPARLRHGPHLLETWPSVLSGLTRPPARQVLAELALDRFIAERATPHTPAYQVLLPHLRLDVSRDDEQLTEELARELARPAPDSAHLLLQLARGSRAVERLLVSGPGPEGARSVPIGLPAPGSPLGALIHGPAMTTAPVKATEIGPLVIARLWSSWRRSSCALTGGQETLELSLHELVLAAGGEIIADANPVGMLVSPDGVPRGLMLEGHPGTLLARGFVLGLSPRRLRRDELLGPRSWLPRPTVVARRCVLHLLFRRGWLPRSMAGVVLLFPREETPLLALRSDPTLNSDEVAVSVVAPLDDPDELPAAEARILEAMRGVVPFFDEAFVGACSPHREHGVPLRSVLSLHASTVATGELPATPGLPLDPGLGNTALVHPLVLGALGTEGAFVSARSAADLLSRPSG